MIHLRSNLLILFAVIKMWVHGNVTDFKSVPTLVKTVENDTVLLPCYLNTASSTDTGTSVEIRWYRDSQLVAKSGPEFIRISSRHVAWENGSLQITTVQPEDTGNYTCEIIRPSPWSPVKQVHAIEVLHPPSVEPDPASGYLQVKLGELVRISCKPEGVPYPLITWKHEGRDFQLLDNREMLKFTATERHLAGEYECTAINGYGNPASAKIYVNIIYPPVLMTQNAWVHTGVGYGHFAQLDCSVSANPSAFVTWYKGEIPIPFDKRVFTKVDDDKYTLFIKNVQTIDFGVYTCRAENSLGRGEVHIQLSGAPTAAVFKKTKNLATRNSYTLIWHVDSYIPIIEYSLRFRPYRPNNDLGQPPWTKLTIPSEASTGSVFSRAYNITGLNERAVYEAVVMSRNKFGWSKPSSVLRFATEGADLHDEILTPVHIATEDINALPMDFMYGNSTTFSINLSLLILSILLYFF